MNRFSVAIAISSFCLPTLASAGDCDTLEKLRAAVPNRFSEFRLATDKFGFSASSYVMDGAKSCWLGEEGDKDILQYSCEWYVSKDENEARAIYDQFIVSVQKCYKDKPSIRIPLNKIGKSTTFSLGSHESTELEFEKDGKWWEVLFEYAWYDPKGD